MKNILIISAVFPPEPIVSANLSFDIANELSVNNSVIVISPKPSRPYGFHFNKDLLNYNFKHFKVNSFICAKSNFLGRFIESISFGKCCYNFIKENNKEISSIYANSWPLFGQYFAVKASKKYNIPIIIHVQDIYPESIGKKIPYLSSIINYCLTPVDKYVLKNSTKIIAISQKMKEYLIISRNLEIDKITVVQNWQDENSYISYSNKLPLNNTEKIFTFMYLGNIGPVAGVDILINAFYNANLKNAKLIIAGSGSSKEKLIKYAAKFSNCNIKFLAVPEGKVSEMQSRADILILPIKKGSSLTSIPSKLSAYMLSAKPIIACVDSNSDTAIAIYEAKCGWVIKPENIENLTSLMTEIYSLPFNNLNIYGKNGRNYALNNYSKKNNLTKIISVMNTVLQ